MEFFNEYGIDREAVLDYYMSKLDIWNSQRIKKNTEDGVKYLKRYLLELDRQKSGKQKETALETFGRKILERAIEYTPYESDELHKKKHEDEPHLRDAYEVNRINNVFSDRYGNDIYIVNRNSYAAAVHEDHRAYHVSPTRADYLQSAALEVSAEYGNPFYIYIKIGPENVELYISSNEFSAKNNNGSHSIDTQYTRLIDVIDTSTNKSLTRNDILSLKGISEKLGSNIFNSYAIRTENVAVGDGFKLLVNGTDNLDDMQETFNDEINIRKEVEKAEREDNSE